MAAQKRAPRRNPLIPVEPAPAEVKPQHDDFAPSGIVNPDPMFALSAPICGQCWPGGWASLPEGADFASCEHGEWSTREAFIARLEADLSAALARPGVHRMTVLPPELPSVIDGVTTDGTPVTVTIRPGEPALISLSDVQLGSVALTPTPSPLGYLLQDDPVATVSGPTVSPFKPKPAPAPVEVEPGELDTGDDVMFMPSGG